MKPNLTGIKALVFDAYGTLLDVKSLDERLRYHFGELAIEINYIWRQKQLQYTWLRSLMDKYKPFSHVTKEALEFACREVGVRLDDEIMADLMDHYFILTAYPEVPELLERLSDSYKCAILSNADMPMLQKACDFNSITGNLDAILSVDSIGINKPSPKVYQMAIDHFNCDRKEIAFISSNTWDVAGASAFGFTTIWLKRSGNQMESMGYPSTWKIRKLEELVA